MPEDPIEVKDEELSDYGMDTLTYRELLLSVLGKRDTRVGEPNGRLKDATNRFDSFDPDVDPEHIFFLSLKLELYILQVSQKIRMMFYESCRDFEIHPDVDGDADQEIHLFRMEEQMYRGAAQVACLDSDCDLPYRRTPQRGVHHKLSWNSSFHGPQIGNTPGCANYGRRPASSM